MGGCMYVSRDVCMYVGTYMYVGMWGRMYVCGDVFLNVGMCICMWGCMYVCGVYVHMYVCMCVGVYAYVFECIYRHTWAKGNRECERNQ
jgi:hypothetical protein